MGMAVSPLLAMAMMVATTFCILYNSYRVKPFGDNLFEPKLKTFFKRFIASDWSLGLLMLATTISLTAVVLSVIATGGLIMPILGIIGGGLFSIFALTGLGYMVQEFAIKKKNKTEPAPILEDEKIEIIISNPDVEYQIKQEEPKFDDYLELATNPHPYVFSI